MDTLINPEILLSLADSKITVHFDLQNIQITSTNTSINTSFLSNFFQCGD